MRQGPSRIVEAVVGIFIPPACREEVLGDLCERYSSSSQYAADAVWTVPMVIISRMRRTSDPQVALMQAFATYLSFLGAAWFLNRELLSQEWGLMRLAVPGVIAMAGLILADAYRSSATPPVGLRIAQGPCLGVGLAFICQNLLSIGSPDFLVPRLVMICGGGMSLLLSTAIRLLFPPAADQLQGADAPAYWLERAGGRGSEGEVSRLAIRILKAIAAVSFVGVIGIWAADRSGLPKPQVITMMALLVVAYKLSRRS